MCNPSSLMFFCLLILGTVIVISSNSWLATWMGLEMNLLSFIPLISTSFNTLSTEASLHYFLIQAVASSLLLFFILSSPNFSSMFILSSNFSILISFTLFLKLGAAPFHYWFPKVMEGLTWNNCLLLMTWQKIAPFSILFHVIFNSMWFYLVAFSSIMIGSMGGLNQTSLRKILAYSSINHLGWLTMALQSNKMVWIIYFLIYSLMNFSLTLIFSMYKMSHINQFMFPNQSSLNFNLKIFMCMNFLSLGGLPPFLGFFPKWLVIETFQNMFLYNFFIIIMILTTVLTLYFYLRITFSIFLLSSLSNKWLLSSVSWNYNSISVLWTFFSSSFSVLGLPLLLFFFIFL